MLQTCWAVLREGAEAATGSMAPRDVLPLSLNVDATPRHFSRSGRVKWQPKLMVRTCDSDPIWPFSHSKLFEAVLWQEVIPEQAWLLQGFRFYLLYEAMDKNMQGRPGIWNIQFSQSCSWTCRLFDLTLTFFDNLWCWMLLAAVGVCDFWKLDFMNPLNSQRAVLVP